MLKVLYLPIGTQSGTVDAFKNVGVELETFDFYGVWEHTHNKQIIAQQFLEKIRKFKPKLVHMQLQFTALIEGNTIRQARQESPGTIFTNWSGDVRAAANASFVDVARAVDYSLISSSGQLDMYHRAGCPNVKYWQIGYDPKNSFPKHYNSFKYDVSFIGNHYGNTFPGGPARLDAAAKCRNAFGTRFGIFGHGFPGYFGSHQIDSSEANEIYNQSICALSISNFNDVSHYFSDRLLYCLASGRPTISWHFPGFESYFTEGQDIFIARSSQEIVDIVNYCKHNPDIANQVGINGYKRALAEHSFTSRVIELLHMTNLIHLV